MLSFVAVMTGRSMTGGSNWRSAAWRWLASRTRSAGPVADPPGLIDPAGPVHHLTGDRRDLRRDGHRQAAGRYGPAVLPAGHAGE